VLVVLSTASAVALLASVDQLALIVEVDGKLFLFAFLYVRNANYSLVKRVSVAATKQDAIFRLLSV
jgi:hypothetical protein